MLGAVLLAGFLSLSGRKQDVVPRNIAVPVDQAWMDRVATLTGRDSLQAVVTKLRELNEGFDGSVTDTLEGEVVVGLTICTDHLSDISPLKALTGLKSLTLEGTHDADQWNGRLADLSALKGMELRRLEFPFNTRVTDLSPLVGMPLERLHCGTTGVSDLSPVRGMTLRVLNCGRTQVSDLSPLKGMPLEELYCYHTKFTDLSPLMDLHKLRFLYFDYQEERDAAILRSIPTLGTINDASADAMWAELDQRQANDKSASAIQ